ncbi:hypothetical protein, conserved [Eimeria maxima]|uniref:Uncharacterized protein n=1 Tax=Eimeria maxima TaxID=5804 RepID=U6MC16_EIMMA|nr:hypothetical protein, conserved [Eimeria maxima]CDJ61777.1 hypothetical protein, conserved [Eimeria maxima]
MGAGEIVQCLVTATPAAADAAPANVPPAAAAGEHGEARETNGASSDSANGSRGIVPFFVDEAIPVRPTRGGGGAAAGGVAAPRGGAGGGGMASSAAAAGVPTLQYSISEQARQTPHRLQQVLTPADSSNSNSSSSRTTLLLLDLLLRQVAQEATEQQQQQTVPAPKEQQQQAEEATPVFLELLFIPAPDDQQQKSSKKHQLPKICTKYRIVSAGVDSTIQLWKTEKQLAVGGTAECSPLGESVALLSPSAVLVASHRDDRQLMVLRLPDFETLQVLDINTACCCGPANPQEAVRPAVPQLLADSDSSSSSNSSSSSSIVGKVPIDEGTFTTQFYCCRVSALPEGTVAACCGGNRNQIRTYFLPGGLESAGAGSAASSSSSSNSSNCPCSRNAFHLFGLETAEHPPLTLDICCAAPPPPQRKQQQNKNHSSMQPEAAATDAQLTKQSIISSFVVRAPKQQQHQQQQDQQHEEEEEKEEAQAVISGVILVAIQGQIAIYGIAGGQSDLSPEFSRLRQQMLQRRNEENLDAAAAARVLQAHAAAAAAAEPAAAVGDRKGVAAHDRDDDEKVCCLASFFYYSPSL